MVGLAQRQTAAGHARRDPHVEESPVALLTGATGFLGTRLLQKWLEEHPGRVVCVVRAANDVAAEIRLRDALRNQLVDVPEAELSRVRALAGDLRLPNFGWPTERWKQLARDVAKVVHCAVRVNIIDGFDTLRPDNVTMTQRVLQFISTGRRKCLNYASTLSVFVGTDRHTGLMREDDDLSQTAYVYGGYAQSKWAAEMLVRRSRLPDDRLQITRFGLLTGDSRSGVVADHDLLTMTIRGLVRMGCVPHPVPALCMDVTPVDFAASALVKLARYDVQTTAGRPAVWHVANPQPLSGEALFSHLQSLRPDLAPADPTEFRRRLQSHDDPATAAACLGLSRWLAADGQQSSPRTIDLFQATGAEFEMTRTLRVLAGYGLRRPRPDAQLIERYIQRILQVVGTN